MDIATRPFVSIQMSFPSADVRVWYSTVVIVFASNTVWFITTGRSMVRPFD